MVTGTLMSNFFFLRSWKREKMRTPPQGHQESSEVGARVAASVARPSATTTHFGVTW